jgi:tRNA-dihydrouridine synthase B
MQTENFWKQIKKPILALSPMDGLTDQPFRYIQKKYGAPAVMYTEFTSVEGVCHGATQLLKDFLYDETQRPIIAQIYGTTPEYFRQTALILCELGFDGIDINMGCPAKNVAHSGAGAALIKTPQLAQEIIAVTKQGVIDWQNGMTVAECPDITQKIEHEVKRRHDLLPAKYQEKRTVPVSVKTRIGYDEPVIEEWIPTLLEMEPTTIAIHGRTLKQQYGGSASWENIGKAAAIIKKTETIALGNGDVQTHAMALDYVSTYGVDGVLLGRASLGNPYVFLPESPAGPNIFQIAVEHSELFEQIYKDEEKYSFMPMRKHLAWYVKAIPNATDIRIQLVQATNAAQVREIFQKYQLI